MNSHLFKLKKQMYRQDSFIKKINFKFLVVPVLFIGLILVSFIPIWTDLGFCPNFYVMMLYLWLIYRPDIIQVRGLVIVSLVQDGLYGYPLGISIVEMMPLFLFAKMFRRLILQKSFGFVFCGYVAYLFVFSLVKWLVLSTFKQEWLPALPIFNLIIFSVLVYPMVCHISLVLQKYIDRH